ncbi:MAG: HlyC/CorC family transporter [Planctomycetes bacterium]|nr:HlyC/CorC family transporter [Planctomycetota bacterium]NOG54453.1 HlyC/CorC family transporter [Planctomycetota bacterium]
MFEQSQYWNWITVISAVLSAYCSALQMSLVEYSRGELELKLKPSDRKRWIDWMRDREEELILSVAVWRRLFAAVLILSVLLSIGMHGGVSPAAVGGSDEATLSAQTAQNTLHLAIGALIVFGWLWLVDVGVAWSISEHVATPMVRLSLWLLPTLDFLSKPFVIPLLWLSEAIRRLVGAEQRDDLEEELRQVVEDSQREGNIGEAERDMIEAVVDFRTATVYEVMTPRIDVEGIELSNDLEAIKAFVIEAGHSRFPVYTTDLDHIEGILYVKDLLPYVGRPIEDFELKLLLRQAILVPESRRIADLLSDFQKRQVHMAIVLDEYGGTAGLVTIEDIVEEIVGEIHDEHEPEDEAEPSMHEAEDGTVVVDARYHIDDLNDEWGTTLPEDQDFDTVGGWVFATVGRIPEPEERFVLNGIEVTVMTAERTHLKRVRLRKLSEEQIQDHLESSGASADSNQPNGT